MWERKEGVKTFLFLLYTKIFTLEFFVEALQTARVSLKPANEPVKTKYAAFSKSIQLSSLFPCKVR